MSLTFYFAPMSTASTVHWSLEELGVPYEGVKVDLSDTASKTRALAPVNPNLKVPVLVHDGIAIFESAAIQIYLGETFGVDKGLFPAPGPKRGEALKWLVWANVTLGEPNSRLMRHTSDRSPAELHHGPSADQARRDLQNAIRVFEESLGDKPYVLGKDFSLVDCHLASFFQWLGFCGIDLKPFPKTAAWVDRCNDRPANRRLMPA